MPIDVLTIISNSQFQYHLVAKFNQLFFVFFLFLTTMTAKSIQPIEPTQPARPTLRTSRSIDGFVLRRMQSDAKMKWENQSNKSLSFESARATPAHTKSAIATTRPRRQIARTKSVNCDAAPRTKSANSNASPRKPMRKIHSADATLERPKGGNRVIRGIPDFNWNQGVEATCQSSQAA